MKKTKLKKGDVCVYFHDIHGMMIGYIRHMWSDSFTLKLSEIYSIWFFDAKKGEKELTKIGKMPKEWL